jgi:hypothetical protein
MCFYFIFTVFTTVGFGSPPPDPFSIYPQTDRQTNSFIKNSIEADILLGGNGVLHAMVVAHALMLARA